MSVTPKGNVSVTPGDVTTVAAGSTGISISGSTGNVNVTAAGALSTYSHGILINDTDGFVLAGISKTGSIITYGVNADGIYAADSGDGVTLDIAGSVSANGIDSNAARIVNVQGAAAVGISGSVSGGAGNGAGIYLNNPNATSSSITIESTGQIGALSDIPRS